MKAEKNEDRLGELCTQALSETDREQLLILFREINHILLQHIVQVQQVFEKHRELEASPYTSPQVM